jgi:hypothetical protein
MEKKVRFETIAELQETYPVDSVFSEVGNIWINDEYYYNDTDLKNLKQKYDSVVPIGDNTCICKKKETYKNWVEGYLYDGEYWRPARYTRNGWLPYDEDD